MKIFLQMIQQCHNYQNATVVQVLKGATKAINHGNIPRFLNCKHNYYPPNNFFVFLSFFICGYFSTFSFLGFTNFFFFFFMRCKNKTSRKMGCLGVDLLKRFNIRIQVEQTVGVYISLMMF